MYELGFGERITFIVLSSDKENLLSSFILKSVLQFIISVNNIHLAKIKKQLKNKSVLRIVYCMATFR
jgi:hypothetical protein